MVRAAQPSTTSDWRARLVNLGCTGVVASVHGLCLLIPFVQVSWPLVAATAGSYLLQVFGITGGYHRYFSHRAFRTGRVFQFILGWLGASAMQNGPIWWASSHRKHHRFSDGPGDPHSPVTGTLWHAHIGWVLSGENDRPDLSNVQDLTRFPELRFIDQFKWLPTVLNAVLCYLWLGLPGLVWVFGLGTTLAFHAPLFVNSFCHRFGAQRFATGDASRNNALFGVLVLGEGWHNNHHHAQATARHGRRWWELDVTYYGIRVLQTLGVVWHVRQPDHAAEKLAELSASPGEYSAARAALAHQSERSRERLPAD